MAGIRIGAMSQAIDIQGSVLLEDDLTPSLEGIVGRVLDSGADGQIIAATKRFVSASAAFTAASIGQFIRITGAGEAGNNGEWLITEHVDGNTVVLGQATTLVNESDLDWTQSRANSLEDDLNQIRTDRKAIKGTAYYNSTVPVYQRPSAPSADVAASLANLAGMTLDAKSKVINVRQASVKLRPGFLSSNDDLSLTASSDTVATTNYNFIADDLNSFLEISGSTSDDGVYRIKEIVDGKTIKLAGLSAGNTESGIGFLLYGGMKAILSSRVHATSSDRRGIPIADSGAYDETNYNATYAELIDNETDGPIIRKDSTDRYFLRAFGAEKVPFEADPSGTFFVAQIMHGDNDGTATEEQLTDRPFGFWKSDFGVVNATKQVTGDGVNISFTPADVGKWVCLCECGADGNQGLFQITEYIDSTHVLVDRTGNFVTDPNSGSIEGWYSDYQERSFVEVDVYNGDRYRLDEIPETAERIVMTGGVTSDAELAEEVRSIRQALGIASGATSFDGAIDPAVLGGNYILAAATEAGGLFGDISREVGDRTYTGAIITSGETIAESLQALADAVAGSSIIRTIERLSAGITAGTSHVLPGGISYTLDGTGNGKNMFVFWRGLLRDPGSLDDDDDYEETDTTHITPYSDLSTGDHVTYMILQ